MAIYFLIKDVNDSWLPSCTENDVAGTTDWFNSVNPEIICAFLTQKQLLSYPIELKFSSFLVSDCGPLLDCTSIEIFYVGNSKSSPSMTE